MTDKIDTDRHRRAVDAMNQAGVYGAYQDKNKRLLDQICGNSLSAYVNDTEKFQKGVLLVSKNYNRSRDAFMLTARQMVLSRLQNVFCTTPEDIYAYVAGDGTFIDPKVLERIQESRHIFIANFHESHYGGTPLDSLMKRRVEGFMRWWWSQGNVLHLESDAAIGEMSGWSPALIQAIERNVIEIKDEEYISKTSEKSKQPLRIQTGAKVNV